MNTRILSLSLLGLLAISASVSAQEVTSQEEYLATTPARKVAFEPSCRHWFIQAFGSLSMPFDMQWSHDSQAELRRDADFGDRASWGAGLAVGQHHNPYFSTRLALDYHTIPVFGYNRTDGEKGPLQLRALNPHFDFMFDLVNYFSSYDESRVFHVVPFLGVGYLGTNVSGYESYDTAAPHARGYSQGACDANFLNIFNTKGVNNEDNNFFRELDHSISANLGLDININFHPRVALTIEPMVLFFPGLEATDALGAVRGGLTCNLGETLWNGVQPMDWDLVNGLQSQINDLRSQNAELSKRPVRCPECPEVKQTVVEKNYENVVYFRIDSSKIDKNQEINLFNTAEYVKANNTPITVTGYADVQTGRADYNMQLSEKRARNVADKLISEYGVPSELITIDYKGSDVQPYDVNAWNRVVIMKSK